MNKILLALLAAFALSNPVFAADAGTGVAAGSQQAGMAAQGGVSMGTVGAGAGVVAVGALINAAADDGESATATATATATQTQ